MVRTEARRKTVSDELGDKHRSAFGQFFTPEPVARFLASLLHLPASGPFTVIDPGAGVGSLTAAVVSRVVTERPDLQLHVVACEVDEPLLPYLQATLNDCEAVARGIGANVTTELRPANFITWAARQLGELSREDVPRFSACVMNPPYKKVSVSSPERAALQRVGVRVSNLYPAFLALSAGLLVDGGQLSAITPRSFANGPYFEDFRRFFLRRMAFRRLHVFERRGDVFADVEVLQENVVFHAVRGSAPETVMLSSSQGYRDEPTVREVPTSRVVGPDDPHLFVHIPVDEHATAVAESIANLGASLTEIPLQVSTGRVVDFRAREHLIHDPDPESTVPLIYPTHFFGGRIQWPKLDGRKPNALERCDATASLLLPNDVYVLVKRFTAKEERRRVVAALYRPDDAPADEVAFENHLNVFHRNGRGLPLLLALGLTMYLNSTVVDDFVRQFSGHTQINATDLRLLRYPTAQQMVQLGQALVDADEPTGSQTDIDNLVAPLLLASPSDEFQADETPALLGA
jgi:adenine-specific DNA-methyltransferase